MEMPAFLIPENTVLSSQHVENGRGSSFLGGYEYGLVVVTQLDDRQGEGWRANSKESNRFIAHFYVKYVMPSSSLSYFQVSHINYTAQHCPHWFLVVLRYGFTRAPKTGQITYVNGTENKQNALYLTFV